MEIKVTTNINVPETTKIASKNTGYSSDAIIEVKPIYGTRNKKSYQFPANKSKEYYKKMCYPGVQNEIDYLA
jgi:hypothetical protein